MAVGSAVGGFVAMRAPQPAQKVLMVAGAAAAITMILGNPMVSAVLVLEGAQGISKSSALRALGGQRHFESLIDIDDKEGYMALAGVWLAEFSEGEAFSRSSVKRVTSRLSATS